MIPRAESVHVNSLIQNRNANKILFTLEIENEINCVINILLTNNNYDIWLGIRTTQSTDSTERRANR